MVVLHVFEGKLLPTKLTLTQQQQKGSTYTGTVVVLLVLRCVEA